MYNARLTQTEADTNRGCTKAQSQGSEWRQWKRILTGEAIITTLTTIITSRLPDTPRANLVLPGHLQESRSRPQGKGGGGEEWRKGWREGETLPDKGIAYTVTAWAPSKANSHQIIHNPHSITGIVIIHGEEFCRVRQHGKTTWQAAGRQEDSRGT